jgi:hypothetical protein
VIDPEQEALIDEAWRLYLNAADNPVVVKPSIPLPYWGDGDRYAASPLKIVTVGLNPSRREFPAADPFLRFRAAEGLDLRDRSEAARSAYLVALHDYFRIAPYRSWFDWFEQVLRGMGASFYDGAPNTAVHADLCSPLATDPTWSRLDRGKEALLADGVSLWHRLIAYLAPDVILISVAGRYRDLISFASPDGWEPIYTVSRDHLRMGPYVVMAQRVALPGRARPLLVYGPAARLPFSMLDRGKRQEIGRAVLGLIARPE